MSFQIERGLFVFDFIDHHAVLGVPIDADPQTIRKRYLKIARRLHPDSYASESDEDKNRASEFLSKLVNPAWEKLSQDKERTEYDLTLKMVATQRSKQAESTLSNMGRELLTASNPDHFYRASIKNLADKQFDHLDQSLEIIGQMSELNMVYVARRGGELASPTPSKSTIYTGSNLPDSSQSSVKPNSASAPPPPSSRKNVTDQYCRRAEGYVAKNNYAQAVLELRDALQMDPRNVRCHALLGEIYLRQNQATMARIHFDKALEIDPQNEQALAGKRRLEARSSKSTAATNPASGTTSKSQKSTPKSNKPDDKSGGGLFGLFGGKKKS